ncbi:NDP-hexose 2,3-dehydratase family protein [Streptomyces sp. NPDC001262]|uniref:NDP-hexose 2,3-dehydratase family protein n=1 Tax=unclassified Streptomyces TaxID=2593676 RepID=UPI00369D278C
MIELTSSGIRLAEPSAAAAGPAAGAADQDLRAWLRERRAADRSVVRRIPFAELRSWSFEPGTGALRHDSGRFFSVEGLCVHEAFRPQRAWAQPIIDQPEVGILGILVKDFGGTLHCLMQAKMEPGNPGLVQLSPTVQATLSNYSRVHRGAAVPYLQYFTGPDRGRVVVDVEQPEHGAWFLGKKNRNMVVEAAGPVPEHEDFRWVRIEQLAGLLREDNAVNMDARTVLSCLPVTTSGARGDGFRAGLLRSFADRGDVHGAAGPAAWIAAIRRRRPVRPHRVPLAGLSGWYATDSEIAREDRRFFTVIAVDVQADRRETACWTQPLFATTGLGLAAFLVRRFRGVPHVLAHARAEAGIAGGVAIGPTVQCVPANHDVPPRYVDAVLGADPSAVRYCAVHSEEGGRFHRSETRYVVVEAGPEVPDEQPPDFRWVTLGELSELLLRTDYVNVQARTLIACLKLFS